MKAQREDLLPKVGELHKSYRLCSAHFETKMFTNHLQERLCANAIPTLFPSLEGCSRDLGGDHTYSSPALLPLKINVIQDIQLVPPEPQATHRK